MKIQIKIDRQINLRNKVKLALTLAWYNLTSHSLSLSLLLFSSQKGTRSYGLINNFILLRAFRKLRLASVIIWRRTFIALKMSV